MYNILYGLSIVYYLLSIYIPGTIYYIIIYTLLECRFLRKLWRVSGHYTTAHSSLHNPGPLAIVAEGQVRVCVAMWQRFAFSLHSPKSNSQLPPRWPPLLRGEVQTGCAVYRHVCCSFLAGAGAFGCGTDVGRGLAEHNWVMAG